MQTSTVPACIAEMPMPFGAAVTPAGEKSDRAKKMEQSYFENGTVVAVTASGFWWCPKEQEAYPACRLEE